MKLPFQRFFFLLPLLLTVVLIIFGEALGDLWKEDVKALFQQNKWLLLAFVGLLALVGLLWDRRQNNENTVPETVDKDQYDEAFAEFRKNLLEQYQGRLNSKTGRRLPVNLTAKSTNYGFDPERAKVFLTNQTIESDNIASEIDKILNANARLLFIGDPGAGKTTILLYAAINILNDAGEPKLPLILNLATWTKDRDFAEWYTQNIAHTYSLSPVFVRELLRRNAVVPFFDGFDEVAEEHRDDCFRKMAAYFGDEKRKQLIVSSRKKEYASAEADAPVYAEIEVQPLSLVQIKKALTENAHSQAADRALLHALEHDRSLAEAVETPFYLNTASFLFGKGQRTLSDFPFKADSSTGRQAELVEIFVAEQVPEERDRKYLSFLAGKMEQENISYYELYWLKKHSFIVFDLIKMQPWWCENFWLFRILVGMISGLWAGLFFGFTVGLFGNVHSGMVTGLTFFCIVLLGSLVQSKNESKIDTEHFRGWSWQEIFRGIWKKEDSSSNIGCMSALLGWLIGYFLNIPEGGFIIGLAFGFTFSIIHRIQIAGAVKIYLPYASNPYQFFFPKIIFAIWSFAGFVFAIVVTLFISYSSIDEFSEQDFSEFLSSFYFLKRLLLIIALLPISFLMETKFLEHFSLRFVLHLEGKIPLRVVTFLDRMTDQLIFEDNRRTNKKGKKMRGATWRFRHKILQDYFARRSA